MSAQATRLYNGIGVGAEWTDVAGNLRELPYGTRLPPPPPLTPEVLARARAPANPAYPRGSSPSPRPFFGPQTYEEWLEEMEELAAHRSAW
ncbi:hypothetical protein Cob_v004870 [Colletotrichum orbiculare MAFF 240422]|uniref:Uncharacterized protein n=1 Tax=Colletotrichum orbiculare (strain 104-T / ATCC 96160 / CBS 514.97 / LARS 414 / MAFF 240422) TaxID=1213857 RepID=N4UU74_COLOR|nr:hypothetical protein Cob_v004870 [Colletotrichum orbiculare MAFF 240422]